MRCVHDERICSCPPGPSERLRGRDPFEVASELPHSVWVQKHSATTYVADVKSPTIPPELRRELDRSNVGKLWRARLGRNGTWFYGWTPAAALQAALDALDEAGDDAGD